MRHQVLAKRGQAHAVRRVPLLWVLLYLAVVACLAGVPRATGGEAEKAAAAKIASLGGKATVNADGKVESINFFGLSDGRSAQIDFSVFSQLKDLRVAGLDLTDKSLVSFKKIPSDLNSVTFFSAEFTGEGLGEFLDCQKKLQFLSLIDVPITDDFMPRIGKMGGLLGLSVSNTKVTDKGLKELAALPNLRELNLSETEVSDAGMLELAKLRDLWSLNLDGTKVTDAGIVCLAGMKSLKSLHVRSTKVTEEGKAALRKVMPELKLK